MSWYEWITMGLGDKYHIDNEQQISGAVTEALEKELGVDHRHFLTLLIEVINVDSLNSLFDSTDQTDWKLTFQYESLQITITDGEWIDINQSVENGDETPTVSI